MMEAVLVCGATHEEKHYLNPDFGAPSDTVKNEL